MTKDEIQETAVEKLEQYRRYVCQWATGCGKSGVAIKFLKKHPDYRCLIVVPEQVNIQNWEEEFEKFEVEQSDVMVICYASLHKYRDTEWNLLVLDEVPHMDTAKRMKILQSIKAEYVLALGAVIDDDEMNSLKSVFGEFHGWTIPIHTAIGWGLLPAPDVVVMHMQMDDKIRKFKTHKGTYTALERYSQIHREVQNAVDAYNAKPNDFNKRRMFQAGIKRKRFLGSLKEFDLWRLCDYLEKKGTRFICFCSSIAQAERLGGEKSFTSKSPKSFAHLEKFNNHEIDSLYVVGKLIEGQNLQDIECGVIGQLGGTERIAVQEMGRVMRSTKPVIFVPVFDDTKDDSFLYSLTSSLPKDCIKHINF